MNKKSIFYTHINENPLAILPTKNNIVVCREVTQPEAHPNKDQSK